MESRSSLLTRRWKGGSTYVVTLSPGPYRLPQPGEAIELADMGWVRVMSAYDTGDEWRLVVQDGDIGPQYDDLPGPKAAEGPKTAL